MRTPFLPLSFVDDILNDEVDRLKKLKELFDSDIINEAIYLASPILHKELTRHFSSKPANGKNESKLNNAFLKYLIRMSSRPTPFGLFSGVSIAKIGSEAKISLQEKNKLTRHTRFDMNYLCGLVKELNMRADLKEKLLYYPNSSIYRVNNKIRYVEYSYENLKRKHKLVSVDNNIYLEAILNAAESGIYLHEIRLLLRRSGVDEEDIESYPDELIDAQILISELEPAMSGPEFLPQIIKVFEKIDHDREILKYFKDLNEMIKEIDNNGFRNNVPLYNKIKSKLEYFGTEINEKYLFQVDMKKPAEHAEIDKKIIPEVLKGLEILKKLNNYHPNKRLLDFRKRFTERYGEREVPLLEALDEDVGPGYDVNISNRGINPLIDKMVFPAGMSARTISWDKIQSFYLRKYHHALINNNYEVEITDMDMKPFTCRWDDFPDTFNAIIKLIKHQGHTEIIIENAGGSSAANLIGRFCHCDDDIFDFVKEITRKEQEYKKDNIIAEIIHMPHARTANIIQRPVLRDYEITFLGKSEIERSKQIKADDIFVSVRNEKFMIRSKRLNKFILPRLTTAHYFSFNSLPVYLFLCDLQLQDKIGAINFDWGVINNEYKFLPRARYKNIILSLAKWNLKNEDVKELFEINDEKYMFEMVKSWRKNLKIPQRVLLCDHDNELLIDFESLISIKLFLSMIKNKPGFHLKEFIFNENNSLTYNSEGTFSHEIILSFYKDNGKITVNERG